MNAALVRRRAGWPLLAARLAAGIPSTIVAYGTSMTLFGQYLSALPAALAAAPDAGHARLVIAGLRGFGTLAGAFRVASDVLPHEPDLVLIEFAHNDGTDDAVRLATPALAGIIGQIRAARPACELGFVYLAPPGTAAAGPTPAMLAYEAVADAHGIPSFDLATFSEELVATGRIAWTAVAGPALTIDGIHHSAAAGELLGAPFAAAFMELIRQPGAGVSPAPPAGGGPYLETARAPAETFRSAGAWAMGVPADHAVRNADAYVLTVAEGRTGARLRIVFDGTQALVWTRRTGVLRTVVDGGAGRFEADTAGESTWSFTVLTPPLPPGRHELDVEVAAGPLVLGDLCVAGRLLGGTGAPGVVK